jgi:hypothetical protein
MTTEQIKKLCKLEPEKFRKFSDGLMTFDYGTTRLWVQWDDHECTQRDVSYGFMCWWMLQQMPEGTGCAWNDTLNEFACYVRTKKGRALGIYGSRGFGPTREDAVINAYISWLESKTAE